MNNKRPSHWPVGWEKRYPMVEAKVNRGWCMSVLNAAYPRGFNVQPSACSFCPHRPDTGPGGRLWIKDNEPETFREVEEFDAAIRNGYGGIRRKCYVSSRRAAVADAIAQRTEQAEFWSPDGADGCDDGVCFT